MDGAPGIVDEGRPTTTAVDHKESEDTAGVQLTLVTKAGGDLLSKRIFLDEHGRPKSDGSPCRMIRGRARRVTFGAAPASGLAELMAGMTSAQALVLGVHSAELPDEIRLDLDRRANLAEGTHPRSRETFAYRPGQPAFALIDHDRKGMPPAIAETLATSFGTPVALIETLLPDLERIATVYRASTSAGIVDTRTGERSAGSGGFHLYVLVMDGADIPRFLDTLHKLAWLAGYGWMMVGGAGQILERSIVDRMVAGPERLVFEGAPQVEPPLVQDISERRPVARDGVALDTRAFCPDLSPAERAELDALVKRARDEIAPTAAARREEWIETTANEIAKERAIDVEIVRVAVRARHDGILLPADVLHFDDDDLGKVDVLSVLADPEQFDGETLADPLEGPASGAGKAKLFVEKAATSIGTTFTFAPQIIINSFAHGGIVYRLRHDAGSIEASIRKADRGAADLLAQLLPVGHQISPVDRERLRSIAAEVAGVGKRAVDATIKRAFQKRHAEELSRRRADAMRDMATGGRHVMARPADDAELTPVVQELDTVLSQSLLTAPMVRNLAGAIVHVKHREPDFLHTLTSAGADGAETREDRLDAPAEPLITAFSPIGLRMRIEEEVVLTAQDRDGNISSAALQPHFAAAFADNPRSNLPTINGIVSSPIVLPNGKVLTGNGFERSTGLHYAIHPRINAALPHSVSDEDVRGAYRWLLDNLLVDVLADATGKAIAVAYALTLLERLILDARPAFFIVANQRGGGKTTLVHMITLAVLGRMAGAAAWSPNAEERRKALFSTLREGTAAVCWDNIPRGEAISCPHIEASLTSPSIADRILGVSQIERVPATTVQAFTGNNIGPAGDLASRSLVLALSSDRVDPENRHFTHADPFEWVRASRLRILQALYRILLGNPLLGSSNPGETRFRQWFRLVGSAVEHAARIVDPNRPICFRDLFLQSEEDDDEASGTADFLAALRREFGTRRFTAAQLASVIEGQRCSLADELELLDGLVRATRKSLRFVSSHTVGLRLRNIKDRPAVVEGKVMRLENAAKSKGGDQSTWWVSVVGEDAPRHRGEI